MRLVIYIILLVMSFGVLVVDVVEHNPFSIINYFGMILSSFLIGLEVAEW